MTAANYKRILTPSCSGLSQKFCSAENFGPGPIFSGKIVLGGTIFSEKNGPVLKILFLFTLSLKINYMMHEEANRLEITQFDFQSHNR